MTLPSAPELPSLGTPDVAAAADEGIVDADLEAEALAAAAELPLEERVAALEALHSSLSATLGSADGT